MEIDRRFVRTSMGLVHYRTIDPGTPSTLPPIYMAHAGPGSSLGLVPLIEELGVKRRVIAPDMLGNGDSDAPRVTATDVAFYVNGVVDTLDKLEIPIVDFYGTHTGGHIGCEFALTHAHRVRRLILDGVALFSDELKTQMLARYAPSIEPDEHGGHLAWAWNFVRELYLHFPYFLRDPEHRLQNIRVPSAEQLQPLVVDLIKALPSYHLAYNAVFAHPMANRLPQIKQPTMLMAAEGDPLATYLDEASTLLPTAQKVMVTRAERAKVIAQFLSQSF